MFFVMRRRAVLCSLPLILQRGPQRSVYIQIYPQSLQELIKKRPPHQRSGALRSSFDFPPIENKRAIRILSFVQAFPHFFLPFLISTSLAFGKLQCMVFLVALLRQNHFMCKDNLLRFYLLVDLLINLLFLLKNEKILWALGSLSRSNRSDREEWVDRLVTVSGGLQSAQSC